MKKLIFISGVLVSCFTYAISLGSLDTSFSTNGWDRTGITNFDREGESIARDSMGRILVSGEENFDNNGQTDRTILVQRYLADGTLDASFNLHDISNLTPEPYSLSGIEADDNGGFFLAYSYYNCEPINFCLDTIVYHFNDSGTILGVQNIAFDLGMVGAQNDSFADLIYIPAKDRLAVAITVDRVRNSPIYDKDFGLAIINVNSDGSLNIDTSFDSDGKATCAFNQDINNQTDEDWASGLIFNSLENTIIVGGIAYEGNGALNEGFNQAFCEFLLEDANGQTAGALVEQWSTQPLADNPFSDDKESVSDMKLYNGSLFVAGELTGVSSSKDFALIKYSFNGGDWIIDTNFGPNGTGWTTVNFVLSDSTLNDVDATDLVNSLIVEPEDGSLLLGGTSIWNDNGLNKNTISLARFSSGGYLDTNWGINHSGTSLINLDGSTFLDDLYGMVFDHINESIYIVGTSYIPNGFKRFVAKIHNDQIFGSGFDF